MHSDWLWNAISAMQRTVDGHTRDIRDLDQDSKDTSERLKTLETLAARLQTYVQIAMILLFVLFNLGRDATLDLIRGLIKGTGH